MARAELKIQVRIAWWVPLYLAGVRAVAAVTGMEPNWEKVGARVASGAKVVKEGRLAWTKSR